MCKQHDLQIHLYTTESMSVQMYEILWPENDAIPKCVSKTITNPVNLL